MAIISRSKLPTKNTPLQDARRGTSCGNTTQQIHLIRGILIAVVVLLVGRQHFSSSSAASSSSSYDASSILFEDTIDTDDNNEAWTEGSQRESVPGAQQDLSRNSQTENKGETAPEVEDNKRKVLPPDLPSGKQSKKKKSNNKNAPSNNSDNGDETEIRKWGCARTETPFIFVHVGKAGGGGVRSRMAAAALDYNRTGWHRADADLNYYYPIYDSHGVLHKAKFRSSQHSNYIHPDKTEFHSDFSYEGHGPCGASTPIGHAVGCPVESTFCVDQDQDDGNSNDARCDLVYMGHNLLGSELHWLPTKYLVQWWRTTPWGQQVDDFIADTITDRHTAVNKEPWKVQPKMLEIVGSGKIPTLNCKQGPYTYPNFKSTYKACFQPKHELLDTVTRHVVGSLVKDEDAVALQYAKMMASLPVLRVTVVREPFSWLVSKFFWHNHHNLGNGTMILSDMGHPNRNKNRQEKYEREGKVIPTLVKCDDMEAAEGWAGIRAMVYIFYFCGDHCIGGWADGSLTLDDMERQAAYNLRHSFAVVGLLHKTNDFYTMVKQRVSYMDTSLNPTVQGKRHSTGSSEENKRCKALYETSEFQTAMMGRIPALAALNRLYQIAIEVNEFQSNELAQCSA